MDVNKIYRREPYAGFGNILLQLSRIYKIHPYISKSTLDNEFGTCISLDYFQIIEDEEKYENVSCPIILNRETAANYKYILPQMIRPTLFMKNIIRSNLHLLEGVTAGVSIRRGSYSEDSKQEENGGSKEHYFCSDTGLENFIKYIREESGKVYVAADSPSTKNKLKEIFGDKVTMNETEFVHTSDIDWAGKRTVKNMHDVYLVWFLLSMCPKVYCTGNGMSTFGLTASFYGNTNLHSVHN